MRRARIQADGGGAIEDAAQLLSIKGLRDAGAEIPDDFRLTSRVFEDREQGFKITLEGDPARPPISGVDPRIAWGACGGAGGLTFCGCGGFST
jgi:hypothetical protein